MEYNPDSQLSLFRNGRKVSAVATGEPLLVVMQGATSVSVLLADGCSQDSFTPRLFLENVRLVMITGTVPSFVKTVPQFLKFSAAALHQDKGGRLVAEIWPQREEFECSRAGLFCIVFLTRTQSVRLALDYKHRNTEAIIRAAIRIIEPLHDPQVSMLTRELQRLIPTFFSKRKTVRLELPPKPSGASQTQIKLPYPPGPGPGGPSGN